MSLRSASWTLAGLGIAAFLLGFREVGAFLLLALVVVTIAAVADDRRAGDARRRNPRHRR